LTLMLAANSPAHADLVTPAAGAVAAGPTHTLSLKSDGTVWAWGNNSSGQLGDGTTTIRTAPVQVSGLTRVVAVAAGRTHSLALKDDGTVWAWGDNSAGELGDGTTVPRLRPVQVNQLHGVVAIAAGGLHFNLALKRDGTVSAWGDNFYGQLGDTTRTPRLRPVEVQGLHDVTAISAGYGHAIALLANGSVSTWGWNALGQLGDGTLIDRATPAIVRGVGNAVAVTAGTLSHTLVLKGDGTLLGWGNNYSGQLGDNLLPYRTAPAPVAGVSEIIAIVSGSSHCIAQRRDGGICVWGLNLSGQLGFNTPLYSQKPVPQQNWPQDMTALSAAGNQTVVLTKEGKVLAAGNNDYGQWGDGTTTPTVTTPGTNADVVNGFYEASSPWAGSSRLWHEARLYAAYDRVATNEASR
jgi:alpha-tubulin suppressor-like RCC1 family protein